MILKGKWVDSLEGIKENGKFDKTTRGYSKKVTSKNASRIKETVEQVYLSPEWILCSGSSQSRMNTLQGITNILNNKPPGEKKETSWNILITVV